MTDWSFHHIHTSMRVYALVGTDLSALHGIPDILSIVLHCMIEKSA